MLRGGKSRPRNKSILNMFNYFGIGERAGSGVPNIYDIWEQEGFTELTVEELSGRNGTIITVITLPFTLKNPVSLIKGPEKNPESKADEITARCEAILAEMKRNPHVSRSILVRKLNLTDKQVRTAINHIKESGKAHYEGVGRNGFWIVNES